MENERLMRASVRKIVFLVGHSFQLQVAEDAGGEWGGDWCYSHVSVTNAPMEGGERSARFGGSPPASH